MEQHLQSILDLIKADGKLSEDEKAIIIVRLNEVDKKMSIDEFRIERGESLKKTMSVLLEETIEELEQKRKVVEEKNRDLEIEAALERVRTVAMGMRAADDLLKICQILFEELTALGFAELRNAMINIVNDENGSFLNYDFNSGGGASVTQFLYNSHPVMERQVALTRSASDAFFEHVLTGADLEDFKAFRVTNGEAPDPKLENIAALYYYFYSIGIGSVGISAFSSLSEEKRDMLKRFRNVFDLAYRRYTDIQLAAAQAREAKIELALERVRARTMAMQGSKELGDTAFVLFEQFKELGDAPDQITIGIVNESENLVEFWVTINGKPTDEMFKFSIEEPTVMHKLYTSWKEQKRSLVIDLTGEKLHDYLAYRANVGRSTVSNEMPENRRIIHAAFFSKGVITISTTEPRPEETIRILERFAGVFDGTYTRFLDLKKAEAQARESHIELALERVRARTMAMQRSEELAETVFILFQQFKELGENPDQATIGIINEKDNVIEYWVTMYGSQINKVFKFSMDEPNVTHEIYKGWKAKKTSLVIDLSGKALHAFMKYRESMGGAKFNKDEKRRMINVAFFSKGLINVQSTEVRSVESIRLLERFAGVFEQTYTRFLDLQKAEAQAREAHTEAALERVRSRTMGMQRSEELNEIIKVVYEQFGHLNILTEHAGFIMDYQVNEDMTIWLADKHYTPSLVTIPYFDSPHWNSFNEAKEKRRDFFANLLSFEEKNKFYQDLFKRIPGVTDLTKEYYLNCPGLAISTVLLENVGLYIENFSGIPYTDEENNTLMRFGKVFQQTYTRFLDLEKAEAQAREARIEAALERTRTQSMIMQHSNELDDTLRVFHQQVLLLDIQSAFSFLWLPDEKKDRHIFWAAWAENNSKDFRSKAIDYPLDRNEPATAQCLLDWKGNEPVVSYRVPPDGVESYFAAWQELIAGVEQLTPKYFKDGLYYIEGFMKYGCFGVIVENSLSQEQKKILARFAIEFERTYTRFLDLKKAEAQAREAQIQLAMERVRARTMAMQHSDELPETANLLFKQIQELGMPAWSAGYCNWTDNKKAITLWMSSEGVLQPPFSAPTTEDPSFMHMREASERGETFFVEEVGGEALVKHYQYMHSLPVVAEVLDAIINAGYPLPTFQIFHLAYFEQGFLLFITYERVPEAHEIFKRFAKVFEQTYTRFLDLKKAEAQAREAQIQLALERVRAKAMAMYHSEDLNEVLSVLIEQFDVLGIQPMKAALSLFDAEKRTFTFRTTGRAGKRIIGEQVFDIDSNDMFREAFETWKHSEPNSVFKSYIPKETLPDVWKLFPNTFAKMPKAAWVYPIDYPDGLYNTFAWCKFGFIGFDHTRAATKEEEDISIRFANEFERLYQRFLDLQKAEVQAREAQIELSLERVRAKTMAMHNSEDIADTMITLFDELVKLGVDNSVRCGVNIFDNARVMGELWTVSYDSKGNAALTKGRVDMTIHPLLRRIYEAWKNKEQNDSYELAGTDLKNYYKALIAAPDYPFIHKLRELPKKQVSSAFFFPEGALFAFTVEPLSVDAIKLFKRFTGVFGLTYRRYLDLQKAEKQSRQAQIEVAMEKVRSRSLAMQKPEELVEVAQVLRQEMALLGVEELETSSIYIHHEDNGKTECWFAIKDEHKLVADHMDIDLKETWVSRQMLKFYHSDKNQVSIPMQGENRKEWINYCSTQSKLLDGFYGDIIPDRTYHLCKFSNGYMGAASPGDISPESWELLQRATSVFSFAYTRFSDLQQAEAQAREAQIEAALERVRSRTMGMQKSEELSDVIQVIYEQLLALGFKIYNAGFIMDYKQNDDFNVWSADWRLAFPVKIYIPYFDHPHFNRYKKAKALGLDFDAWKLDFEEKNTWFEHVFRYIDVPLELQEKVLGFKGLTMSIAFLKNVALYLTNYEGILYSDAENATLKRFAAVFEQTYTRFNDLKQAEEQASEAKIEAALERIRSKSLAMYKTDDLRDVVSVLFEQMQGLSVDMGFESVSVYIFEEGTRNHALWIPLPDGVKSLRVPYVDHPIISDLFDAKENGADYFEKVYTVEEKNTCAELYFELTDYKYLPEEFKTALRKAPGYAMSIALAKNSGICVPSLTGQIPSGEDIEIMKRVSRVFEQAYTRFKDLEQAEEQSKESKIQLALERVRARTMAMQKSEELPETSSLLFQQAKELGEEAVQNSIAIVNEEAGFVELSTTVHGSHVLHTLHVPIDDPYVMAKAVAAWKSKCKSLTLEFKGQELKDYNILRNSFLKTKINFPEDLWIVYISFFSKGWLSFSFNKYVPDELIAAQKRFASVFDQTFTRFNDLKQAEEQARESQIQLALERVRARTMAMSQSDELAETSVEVFRQLISLGITPNRLFIGIIKESNGDIEFWATDEDGSKISTKFTGNMKRNRSIKKMYNAWKAGKKSLTVDMQGKELADYFHYLADELKVPFKLGRSHKRRVQSIACFSQGFIGMASPEAQPEETISLMERFAGVFNLTYTRFSDLKQAEEQARESKIEAALEKVRGKALAMYSSADLTSTASMVFTELRKLGINPIRCGVGMMNNKSRKVALYSATTSEAGAGLGLLGWVMLADHPVLDKIYDSLLAGQDYYPVLKGQQLKAYYGKLLSGLSLPTLPDFHPGEEQYGHFFPFADGCLYAWAGKAYDDTEIRVLKRFASVIDLTFRRYIELQKSETSAREAVRAASLDRVRAEIASMRSTNDLERITPLIWNELTILGIPFIRCGVFIVDEQAQLIYTHLSTADGRAISTFNLPFNAEGIGEQVLTAWRAKQVATLHWTAEEFAYNTNNLVSRGTVTSTDRYVTEHPDISLDLHFAPFLQGMLYVGNTSSLTADEIGLVQSLADAFSTAYARYEDFNKLEAAKQQVENTLTDLKAAQTKLIQSEKMASLGELTAGIAHEIQNPLNFVNNFSEVNQEMIDELEEELKAGNIEEALALAADIKQNEEKINHHGKRADGIVKGMLQHSRTSGGEKLPTNINSLSDEFMRLSYHGLRAKDKSFNAEMATHFDPELPKINVIGQDMGRVLLNLFNNAFYAVNQKKKLNIKDYVPEVVVTTSTENGHVIIKVKDNGVGMPEHIKEKIMQPFFTTKPTGEGTGLGLSLTYDMVVKGHGGSIQANSKEGEGSEFVIQLPIN